MTTLVSELYQALKAAGVDDEIARAAAKSVIAIEGKEQLTTKADLAALEASLTRLVLTSMIAVTAIFATIVGFMRVLIK